MKTKQFEIDVNKFFTLRIMMLCSSLKQTQPLKYKRLLGLNSDFSDNEVYCIYSLAADLLTETVLAKCCSMSEINNQADALFDEKTKNL